VIFKATSVAMVTVESEFWSCEETVRKLMEKNYFNLEGGGSDVGRSSGIWPESLAQFLGV